MLVRFYQTMSVAVVSPQSTDYDLKGKLEERRSIHAVVVENGELLGLIPARTINQIILLEKPTPGQLAKNLIRPQSEVVTIAANADLQEALQLLKAHPYIDILPLIDENGRYEGCVLRETILATQRKALDFPDLRQNAQLGLLENLPSGAVLVDLTFTIRYVNPYITKLFDLQEAELVEKPIDVLADRVFSSYSDFLAASPLIQALQTEKPVLNRPIQAKNGHSLWVSATPITHVGEMWGILVSITDVSPLQIKIAHLTEEAHELEQAFALSLPNTKIEHKLKHSPEFGDEYDPQSGLIRITSVIPMEPIVMSSTAYAS